MHGSNDLILESLRAAILAGAIVFLVVRGRHSGFSMMPGARLIILGFSLIMLGTLLDITDEVPGMDRFYLLGDTPVEAFLEKIVGYLGGFLCLTAGFVKLVPAITESSKTAQELRESEEKFRTVFETIPDVVGITRLSDGKVIDLNPAFDELTSIPRAHLIGQSSLERNLWTDPADRERMVQEVMQHGMVRNLEARFNTGDGRVRDSLISARLLMLKGEPHLLSVYKDITEDKQVLRALEESEEKFRSVFETIPDIISITRLRDGLVVDLNPSITEITGIPREYFIGRSAIEMKAWANPADRELMVNTVLAQGSIHNLEAQLNSGNGQVRDCLVSAHLMQLQGEPHILAVFKDITERKRIEEALQQSEATFRKLFADSSDAILLLDGTGVFVECNQAALDLLKMTRQEFLLLPPARISPEFQPDGRRSAESAPEMIALAYRKGLHRFDWTCINAVGGEFIVEVSLMPIVINGQTMLHTTWRDITRRKQIEEALRESEERYRSLFDSSPDPVWIIDKQRFVDCNQAAIDILGYPDKDSLRGTHPSELSPEFQPDGEPSHSKAERMMLIARGKGINRFEWVHRRRDQSDFFAEVTLSALTLQGRQVLYCTWRDITERKRVEENLRESESRYRRLHESMSDAFGLVDMAGNILEVNKAFETMLGYTLEELQQLTYRDITPERWHAEEARILAEQVIPHGYSEIYEKECRRKDGSVIAVELRTYLLTDDQQQPVGMWAILRDISERKAVLKAMQQSEARFRMIFESSPDPLIIARIDGGGILAVNRSFVLNTGIPAEEAQGRNGLELNLWADLNERDEFLRVLSEDGEVVNLETRFRLRDGEIRTGLTSARVILTDEGPCMLISIRDITRQKQAEKVLMEMDRMKSEFISTAAHELRTPLAVVLGYTELLRSPGDFGGFDEAHKAEFLEEIFLKCETLSFIIDEMLDISRIESGLPIALDFQPHQPEAWLTKIIRRFEMQGPRHTFQMDLSGRQPETVICDLHRTTQVLENLLSNAVKYSPRGGTITVSGETVGDNYVISVADQGIGMTPEQASHVFDKFWRADASNTAIGGLGLGMSIAKQIVETHGGRIWVESSPGKGTTVRFSLPLQS